MRNFHKTSLTCLRGRGEKLSQDITFKDGGEKHKNFIIKYITYTNFIKFKFLYSPHGWPQLVLAVYGPDAFGNDVVRQGNPPRAIKTGLYDLPRAVKPFFYLPHAFKTGLYDLPRASKTGLYDLLTCHVLSKPVLFSPTNKICMRLVFVYRSCVLSFRLLFFIFFI